MLVYLSGMNNLSWLSNSVSFIPGIPWNTLDKRFLLGFYHVEHLNFGFARSKWLIIPGVLKIKNKIISKVLIPKLNMIVYI